MASFELSTIVGQLKENFIFHVELNRPKALNAMSNQFFQDIQTAFRKIEEFKKDYDIRVVILTGRGKHFSAGLDLKEAPQLFNFPDNLDGARRSIILYDLIKDWQKSMRTLQDCTLPVLVGIHGYCIGGGIDLITSGDIRYCTEDASFSIKEVDIGMAADIGTLQRIDVINSNSSLTRELIYTSRQFNSFEAKEIGLVSKIVKDKATLEKELWALAENISNKSPVAIYTSKLIMVRQMKKQTDDNLDVMARVNSAMLFTEDVESAIRAQIMKLKAQFPKL